MLYSCKAEAICCSMPNVQIDNILISWVLLGLAKDCIELHEAGWLTNLNSPGISVEGPGKEPSAALMAGP